MSFKKGDRVWVYDCPCKPRLATIISKMDGLEAYQIEFKEGREKIRTYIGDKIYKYPDGLHLMICHMKDDIAHIDRIVMEFEEFSSDLENPNNPLGWHV